MAITESQWNWHRTHRKLHQIRYSNSRQLPCESREGIKDAENPAEPPGDQDDIQTAYRRYLPSRFISAFVVFSLLVLNYTRTSVIYILVLLLLLLLLLFYNIEHNICRKSMHSSIGRCCSLNRFPHGYFIPCLLTGYTKQTSCMRVPAFSKFL